MKIYKDIDNLLQSISNDIDDKKWIKVILKVTASIGIGVAMALTILFLCDLIYENIDYIILVVGGICCLIALIRSMIPQKKVKEEQIVQTVVSNPVKPISLQHQLVTEFMLEQFRTLSVPLHILEPTFEADILDKIPYYTDNSNNVTYFRYNLIMSGEPIEEQLFKEILNQGIVKALKNSKLGNPMFPHNGYYFQRLAIEDAHFTGASWLVVVVLVDNDYAVVLENRAQAQNLATKKEGFTFYKDEDF